MFNPTARYQTRGIATDLPAELIAQMWLSLDTQLMFGKILDYMQIFRTLKIDDSIMAIQHEQEINGEMQTLTVIYLDYKPEYDKIIGKTVYIIDDGDHSTMLFAYEY